MRIYKKIIFGLILASSLVGSKSLALEMGLSEKIGQMIMVGFVGSDKYSNGFKIVEKQIENSQIGGVIYLKRNIRSQSDLREMNTILSSVGPGLTAFIAVDQEGGRVQRLSPKVGFPSTPSAKIIAARHTTRAAFETYKLLAKNLKDLGFNMNFAPVVDLDTNKKNPIIGRLGRSYSSDPVKVVDYASAFIDAHKAFGVLTALKHFPGHGSSRLDTHKGFVDITSTWSEQELEPYKLLIENGYAQFVMSGHLYNGKIQDDGKRHPASLSPILLKDKLRGELKFGGIIVSDDMQMGAIENNYKFKQAVVRAVKAGNNILLFSNDKKPNPSLPLRVRDILISEAEKDPEIINDINRSYELIQRQKISLLPTVKIDRTVTKSLDRSDVELSITPEFLAQMTRNVKLEPAVQVTIN